jgi:hypothetical protein
LPLVRQLVLSGVQVPEQAPLQQSPAPVQG